MILSSRFFAASPNIARANALSRQLLSIFLVSTMQIKFKRELENYSLSFCYQCPKLLLRLLTQIWLFSLERNCKKCLFRYSLQYLKSFCAGTGDGSFRDSLFLRILSSQENTLLPKMEIITALSTHSSTLHPNRVFFPWNFRPTRDNFGKSACETEKMACRFIDRKTCPLRAPDAILTDTILALRCP